MLALRDELLELIEEGYILTSEFMNKIMTELEKEDYERLLHADMKVYTDCFVADKAKFLALLDVDATKLNVKLENAKLYYQNTVSGIEKI